MMSQTPVATDGEALLREATRRLVAEFQPERIYLFGSQARGDAGPDSDYDFVVLVRHPVARTHPLAVRGLRALRGLALTADVIVVEQGEFEAQSEAAASLPATVKREGRVLYAA